MVDISFTESIAIKKPIELTYNNKYPKEHIIVEYVWNSAEQAVLDVISIICMHPQEEMEWWLVEHIDYLDEMASELPKKGVWKVVVVGKAWSSYDSMIGEHDGGVDWDILSANKFHSFGHLKEWWVMFKDIQEKRCMEE